ncbi:ABC transporter substrate-binding protein [Methylocaldum sp.]|uniref:MlaC/ttg2D family ABC transporter substrate-binding protein n=1 Tax=Methylocaldum sp. TaxID=1969727 RepID=UPI002D4315B1|nr:ABC transporter substrate-binding protein [Methylocaldum sp.]HYE37680.1 ABC transporter substrate-binding protein [Methylocaldum sp.]
MTFQSTSTGKAALALCWIFLGFFPVLASAETLLPPQQVIQETSDAVKQALRENDYKLDIPKATRIVREILEPHVDVDRAALLILGKHWRTATPQQRERFKNEFRMLLIRTYTAAFTEYRDWNIRYLPLQSPLEDKKAMVRTEILQPGAKPAAVDYRMVVDANGAWKVYDVLIEGISLVQNYRTTFSDDIARTGSLDSVIQELARRNATGSKASINGAAHSPAT